MSSSLNLSLTDELRQFVDEHSGDGTLYAIPSEFVRDVLRQRKLQLEAQKLREGILEGFQDVIDNRVHEFKGNLITSMNKAKLNTELPSLRLFTRTETSRTFCMNSLRLSK